MDNFYLSSNYELSCKFSVIKWNSKSFICLLIQSYRLNKSFYLQPDRHNNLCLSVSCQLLGSEAILGCMFLHFLKLNFYVSWRHCNLGFKVHMLLICLLCNVFIVRTGLNVLNYMQKILCWLSLSKFWMSKEHIWISTAENMTQECC